MKHVAFWLGWWVVLFWFWFLLVGEWNNQEIGAAAIAATIAASLAELARARTGFSIRIPARGLADVPATLGMVLVDFGIVTWALLASVGRRKVARGRLVSRRLEGGAAGAHAPGARAWTALLACYSPNAYVIDVDPETRTALLHDLVPNRASERPA